MQEKITHEILKDMYDAAFEVLRLAPWDCMEEDENFAVRAGPQKEIFYACVIGSAGISRGIIYYRGARGWDAFERLTAGELPEVDAIQELDAIAVNFDPWKEIDPDSKKRLKRLGQGPGEKSYPSPLIYRPGKQPSLPNASDAGTITQLLRASLPVFRRSLREPEWLLEGPDDLLFHVHSGGNDENPAGEWLPLPDPYEQEIEVAPPDELTLKRLKGKPLKRCEAWEIHVGDSGAAIGDAKGSYIPMVAMFVDASTGFVAGFTLAPASEMPARLPQEFLKAIQVHGALPESLHVKREDVAAWLAPTVEKMGIPVVRKDRLPQAEEAQRALKGFLGKKR